MINFGPLKLAKLVNKKVEHAVPYEKIYDAIMATFFYIIEEMKNDRVVSIDNFATFSVAGKTISVGKKKGDKIKVGKINSSSAFKWLIRSRKKNG